MDKKIKLNRIRELTIALNEATEAYDKGESVLSDKEWDNMYFELESLEKECNFAYRNSPTQKINYEVVTEQQKVKHSSPMLSLAKTKDFNTFSLFCGGSLSVTSLKLDGLSLRLTYNNCRLRRAETRGDGEVGSDVTYLAPAIKNIPLFIPVEDEYIIEGEVIITADDFKLLSLGGYEFKNQRNAAAGSLNLLDAKEVAERNLSFVAWKVVTNHTNSYSHNLDEAGTFGFTVVPLLLSQEPIEESWVEELKEKAKSLGYPIDGLVQTFDDVEFGLSLGMTAHDPRHSLAYKFYDEEYETKLLDIDYDVSRTGQLTPVAVFEPVDIDGSSVSRASLHNLSVMGETLHVPFYLQKIKVIKANQVIPQVTDGEIYGEVDGYFGMGDMLWYKDERAGNAAKLIMLPKVCPVCGKPVSIRKSESGIITLYCDNDGCPRKLNQRINHYCDRKKGLDIRGLSLATIEKLIDLGWLNNIIDLYSLKDHRSKWIKLQGFGEKSVDKILNAIEESKHCKLENFISALGIPLIGLTVAKSIVEYYSTWDDFKAAVGGQWSELPGFGEEMEKAINSFDYSEADKIAEMLSFEIPIIQNESPEDRPPAINVCVTGKLGAVWKKRDDLIAFVESKGSKVTSSVSSKTNYLVCNDTASTSSKHQKAKSLNIPIITETELYELLS